MNDVNYIVDLIIFLKDPINFTIKIKSEKLDELIGCKRV